MLMENELTDEAIREFKAAWFGETKAPKCSNCGEPSGVERYESCGMDLCGPCGAAFEEEASQPTMPSRWGTA